MISLSGRGHGPEWWACPRALSRLYTPSARRRRDPSSRVIDDRTFCRRYEHTSRGTTLNAAGAPPRQRRARVARAAPSSCGAGATRPTASSPMAEAASCALRRVAACRARARLRATRRARSLSAAATSLKEGGWQQARSVLLAACRVRVEQMRQRVRTAWCSRRGSCAFCRRGCAHPPRAPPACRSRASSPTQTAVRARSRGWQKRDSSRGYGQRAPRSLAVCASRMHCNWPPTL